MRSVLIFGFVVCLLQHAATLQREFFMGFLRNYRGEASYTRLIITSPETDVIQVAVNTIRTNLFSGLVSGDEPATVNIPPEWRVDESGLSDRGIHISANSSAVFVVAANVYAVGTSIGTSDTYHILPHQNLTVQFYEYYAMSIGTKLDSIGQERASEVLLVGTEDNTTVTVFPTQTVSLPIDPQDGGNSTIIVQPGQGHTMTLHRLQTLLITKGNLDLTGTRIVSNKPLSVLSGHECGNVPDNVGGCDHVGVHVPPTATWGKRFLLIPFLERPSGQRYKVLSAQNDTVVERTCSGDILDVVNLATSGSVYEFHTTPVTSCYLQSNNPLLVVQLGQGFELDRTGDPSMMFVSPVEQYINSVSLLPLSTDDFSANFITITAFPEHFSPANILLDGQPVKADWTVVISNRTTVGYGCKLPISMGSHTVQHKHTKGRLSVLVYGLDREPRHAYGYLAGLAFPPSLVPVVEVVVDQSTPVLEGNGVNVTVQRSLVTDITTSVQITTVQTNRSTTLTTVAGAQDFLMEEVEVVFMPGEVSKTVAVVTYDDNITEPSEEFVISVVPTNEVALGPHSRVVITIQDNDAVAIGFSGPTKRLLNEVTCIVGILRGQLQDRVEVEVQLVVDYIVAAAANTAVVTTPLRRQILHVTLSANATHDHQQVLLNLSSLLPSGTARNKDAFVLVTLSLPELSQQTLAVLDQSMIVFGTPQLEQGIEASISTTPNPEMDATATTRDILPIQTSIFTPSSSPSESTFTKMSEELIPATSRDTTSMQTSPILVSPSSQSHFTDVSVSRQPVAAHCSPQPSSANQMQMILIASIFGAIIVIMIMIMIVGFILCYTCGRNRASYSTKDLYIK